MREFESTRALAAHTGLPIEADSRGESFPVERDWGIYRGSGYGLEGTQESGWLVTFAAAEQDAMGEIVGDGYLVAHAIDQVLQGPRCLLLGGPWAADRQEEIWRLAMQQEWFKSRAGGAEVDIERLDRWLMSAVGGPR